jgi:hypothetical protein
MRPGPKSPAVIRSLKSVCILALAASTAACGQTVRWDAKFAPNFTPSGHTVSVFGVYKDGQMNSEAWDALRPRLEPLLGGRGCDIGRSGTAASDDPLFTAVDEYARTNGPTDDLLAQLAPAAEGDLILVLVEAGSLPPQENISVVDSTSPAGPSPNASKGTNGLAMYAPKKRTGPEPDVLQLSASLFSVAQGRAVALFDMRYAGDSVAEAEREFTARIGRLLPATTCKGWDWHAKVDPERIRKLASEQ